MILDNIFLKYEADAHKTPQKKLLSKSSTLLGMKYILVVRPVYCNNDALFSSLLPLKKFSSDITER